MNNEDKLLKLVLSDNNLSSFYEYNSDEYRCIGDALQSEEPIIVAVAKIIRVAAENTDKGAQKSGYNEVFNFLYTSLL